ncbi:MAG: hypothetical protein ACOVP3_04410 [Rhodoluna sp.]
MVKERSRAWSSALLVATLTLGLASFGAITPPTPAEANTPCPAGATFVSPNCVHTFGFTGASQTWTAPSGMSTVSISVSGAAGGGGGNGGRVTGTMAVTGGTSYTVNVGGAGTTGSNANGGWNGGGRAGGNHNSEGSGGGMSDIRSGATIIAIAGGGGGKGGWSGGGGGAGGGLNASAGGNGQAPPFGGGGGTQTAGGAGGGANGGTAGTAGSYLQGGTGGGSTYGGGGGGGGYYGGGGGGNDTDPCCADGAGGGGGSSFTSNLVTSVTHTAGVQGGNGSITFTYLASTNVSAFTATNATVGTDGFIRTKSINYSVTFSQPVSGFGMEDVAVSGTSGGSGTWTETLTSGSGAGPYLFTVANASAIDGTVIVTVDAAGITNTSSGLAGVGTSVNTTTIDTVVPTISNISFTAGSNTQTANTISVTFSEIVLGVTANSLTLSGVSGGAGTWSKTLASGSGAGPYIFNINNLSAVDGQLDAQIAANAVTDRALNNNVGSALVTRVFALQPSITLGSLNTFGAGSVTLAPNATIIDRGSSELAGLRVSITGNAQAADSLSFTNNNATNFGTIQSATSTAQVLTLTFSGAQPTLTQWQNAVRAIRFASSTAGSTRTFEFHLAPTLGYNYDNMHFYEWVPTSLSTGDLAITAAAGRSYKGMQGYLTTITSAAENAFVYALQGNLGGWLGATQVTTNSNNWRWATGPESGTQFSTGATSTNGMYVNWWAGEPNNSANHVFMTTQGTWDDLISSQGGAYFASGYTVEYGSLTNGDPATSILKVSGTMTVDVSTPAFTLTANSASSTTNIVPASSSTWLN